MQIIANCLAMQHGKIVMLQKPRRGWWVLPGGKVELTETWPETAAREMMEEAGLAVAGLHLRGVHRLRVEQDHTDGYKERLIAQFSADSVEGTMLETSKEGKLALVDLDKWQGLPMDPGDRLMIAASLQSIQSGDTAIHFGHFTYTQDHELITWRISSGRS